MFRDRDKELKRLEAELLEPAEETDELLEQLYPGQRDVPVYNTDRVELRPEDLSDALERPPKRKKAGCALVLLFAVGVLAIAVWWLCRGGL